MPVNSCVYNVELWIQEFTGANQKTVKTVVVSKFNRKFAAKTINDELWKKNYRLYIW